MASAKTRTCSSSSTIRTTAISPTHTRYADAPTERCGDGSRKTVLHPVDMVDAGIAWRGAGPRRRVRPLRSSDAGSGTLAQVFVTIASKAAQHARRTRKNPAEAGFKSKGGNAHD